eukprot:343179_1
MHSQTQNLNVLVLYYILNTCMRVVNQRDYESQQHNRRFAELQNQYQALESKYKFVQKHCMDIEQKLKQLTRKYSLIIPEYPCQTTVTKRRCDVLPTYTSSQAFDPNQTVSNSSGIHPLSMDQAPPRDPPHSNARTKPSNKTTKNKCSSCNISTTNSYK